MPFITSTKLSYVEPS